MFPVSKGKPGSKKRHPDHQIASRLFGPWSRDLKDVAEKNLQQGEEEDASTGDDTDPSRPSIDFFHKPSKRFRGRLRIEPSGGGHWRPPPPHISRLRMTLWPKWQQSRTWLSRFKSEARNPKLETISKNQISNVPNKRVLDILNFENSDLFRISIFEFRISKLQTLFASGHAGLGSYL